MAEALENYIRALLRKNKKLTFTEICEYVKEGGFAEWDVASTLPKMISKGLIVKFTEEVVTRKFLKKEEKLVTFYKSNEK